MAQPGGWRARVARAVAGSAVLALALFAPMSAAAQVTTASVEGTVKDDSGAVLPGVTVTIVNEASGARRDTVTAENGRFRVAALQPGSYDVLAELTGFKAFARKGLTLEIGQEASVDIKLEVGGLTETVAVTADSPLVETTKSSLSQVVETRQIQNLPLNGRNFQDLAMLVPGARPSPTVDTTKSRGVFKAIAFGAQSGRMTNISLDGGDIADTAVGSVTLGYPLDAIQEFAVTTSRFTAEFGRSSTGAITIITKSGGNQFHGSAFGYFRDKELNSLNYFEKQRGTPKPDFSRQQMGATFGGPIEQDKTHFFLAYERQNENTFAVTNAGQYRQFSEFEGSFKTPYNLDLFATKVDRQINKDQSIFVRYALHNDKSLANIGGTVAENGGSSQQNRTQDTVVGHTWVMSTSTVNELRVHYNDFHNQEVALSDTPRMAYQNFAFGMNTNDPQSVRQKRLQIRDDVSMFVPDLHGQHNLKAGADISRVGFDSVFAANSGGGFTFAHNNYPYNQADPSTYPTRYTFGFGDPTFPDYNTWNTSFYVQDDWKPRNGLTLNLGLRWDAELSDLAGLTNAFTPYMTDKPKKDLNNLAPRLGFVWDLKGDGKTVVRGGYGVYYFLTILNATLNQYIFDGQRYVTLTVDNTGNRADFLTNPLGGKSPQEFNSTNPFNTRLMSPDYATPYSQQSTIGFATQISKDISLDVDYVHILGLREATGRDINLLGVNGGQTTRDAFGIPTPRTYPQFRQVLQYETTGRSRYDGLHSRLNKRFSQNYSAGMSYTLSWAKGRLPSGFGSVPNDQTNIDADYAYQATDERHRVTINAMAVLPWKIQVAPFISFSTPRPFSLALTNQDPNNDTRLSDRPAGLGRSSERGERQFQFDIRVAKEFGLGAGTRLQVLFETFNLTNYVNYLTYNTNATSATVRQPLTAGDPRQAQVGVKFTF
jgi:hypothetical protein